MWHAPGAAPPWHRASQGHPMDVRMGRVHNTALQHHWSVAKSKARLLVRLLCGKGMRSNHWQINQSQSTVPSRTAPVTHLLFDFGLVTHLVAQLVTQCSTQGPPGCRVCSSRSAAVSHLSLEWSTHAHFAQDSLSTHLDMNIVRIAVLVLLRGRPAHGAQYIDGARVHRPSRRGTCRTRTGSQVVGGVCHA